MDINNLKAGDIVELTIITPARKVPHKEKVKVHSIYPKYIVFDNEKWRFCGLKFDLINDEVILAGF